MMMRICGVICALYVLFWPGVTVAWRLPPPAGYRLLRTAQPLHEIQPQRTRLYMQQEDAVEKTFWTEDDDLSQIGAGMDQTVDMFGDQVNGEEDESVLAAMRIERTLANDRWQSCLFRDQHAGHWKGRYEVFTTQMNEQTDELEVVRLEAGIVDSSLLSSAFTAVGVNITISEKYRASIKAPSAESIPKHLYDLFLKETSSEILSNQFRTKSGNQIVGNAYTICNHQDLDAGEDEYFVPKHYVGEVAVVDGEVRHRVRYLFVDQVTAAVSPTERSFYDLFLLGFVVIRDIKTQNQDQHHTSVGVEEDEAVSRLLREKVKLNELGGGLYDLQMKGEPYVELPLPGALTLFFPRAFKASGKTVLSAEIVGKEMRYQVDRVFFQAKGGVVKTLELTEVKIEDAQKYPAGFPERPDLLV